MRNPMRNPIVIIRNPVAYADGSGEFVGRVESAHKTREGAWRRYNAAQKASRWANPGTHLNIAVIAVSSPNEPVVNGTTRGKPAPL